MAPIERTTQYATTVDDLPSAWAFVMERIDTLGPNPRITISPIWAHRIVDMDNPDARMHAYGCTDPLGAEWWHVGHVPVDLKRGWASRDDVEARRSA